MEKLNPSDVGKVLNIAAQVGVISSLDVEDLLTHARFANNDDDYLAADDICQWFDAKLERGEQHG